MNAITKVLPEITEAMTPEDLMACCQSIKAAVGPKAETWLSVSSSHDGKFVTLQIWPRGMACGPHEHFTGTSWSDVFAAANVWAVTHQTVRRNNIVRKMAIAIISITDEHGVCAEARLRAADFSHEEITEFHEAACARASEMCGSAPFSVLMETV